MSSLFKRALLLHLWMKVRRMERKLTMAQKDVDKALEQIAQVKTDIEDYKARVGTKFAALDARIRELSDELGQKSDPTNMGPVFEALTALDTEVKGFTVDTPTEG